MSDSTQGITTYNSAEIAVLQKMYKSGGTSDEAMVIRSVIKHANSAVDQSPEPFPAIITSGEAVKTGHTANTSDVSKQASEAYSLALAYRITGNSKYYLQARNYVVSWSKANTPSGDPIADAVLLPMFHSYDLIQDQVPAGDQAMIGKWMTGIADALIAKQAQSEAKHSVTAYNNHHSFELLEVGTIGAIIGNSTFINTLAGPNGLQAHVANNLRSVPGEPPYLGVDYDLRKAYHYVAYNLGALEQAAVVVDRLEHLPGNPYHVKLAPETKAAMQHTLDALLPYVAGEKQSVNEFHGSTDANDAVRLSNGSLKSEFKPADALPALEAADYFGHTVKDSTGHNYNLAQLAANVLHNENKKSLSDNLPTVKFLQNDITAHHGSMQVGENSMLHFYDDSAITLAGGSDYPYAAHDFHFF